MPTKGEHLKHTTTGTFRITEEHYNALQTRARENRTSLNNLLSQIIEDYLREGPPQVKQTLMVIAKEAFAQALSQIPAEEAERIGREVVSKYSKSWILERHGNISVDAVVGLIRDWSLRANWGDFSDNYEDGMRIIGTTHELGPNVSAMIAAAWEEDFKAAGVKAKILKRDNVVVAEIPSEQKPAEETPE